MILRIIHEKDFDITEWYPQYLPKNTLLVVEEYNGTYWIPTQRDSDNLPSRVTKEELDTFIINNP